MKKLFFSLIMIAGAATTFAQKDDQLQSPLVVTKVNNSQLSGLLMNAFNSLGVSSGKVSTASDISSFAVADFDFVNLYKSEKAGETEVAYSASYMGSGTKTKYAFTASYRNGAFYKPMLIKANVDRSSITYYDLEGGKSVSIIKNSNSQFVSQVNDVDLGGATTGKTEGSYGCEQCVANCIADAYLNHGWASVWVTIQSIFVPATGLAIALGCVGRCCLGLAN